MGYKVITISREYAAYGRTIARKLSERLGIEFYDKDFVKETAIESGYTEEEIYKEGEEISAFGSVMNSILNNAAPYTSSYDEIFNAEKKFILRLEEKQCIIVGRCADHVLHEAGIDCFSVFLYADKAFRLKRAEEISENMGKDLDKLIDKVDNKRKTYYKQYTGHELGDYKNYNICLDTGKIGIDKCVDILVDILK